jgi:hypothetical protein
MDEAADEEAGSEALTVLERLERIRELDRCRAPAEAVLDELRQLVVEAEQWARAEGDARARAAAAELGAEIVRLEEVRPGRVEVHQL